VDAAGSGRRRGPHLGLMSYYSKADNDAPSPHGMYFGGFGGGLGAKDSLEDDLVALINQANHHQSQQQQQHSPQHSQQQQQQQPTSPAATAPTGTTHEWRPPVHDIFGTFPSASYDYAQQSLPSPAPTTTSVPPPTTRHRASVTSRSRSRSTQPRSARGSEANNPTSPGGPNSTRPIPISLGPLGPLPPTSALHGLAQSLPHSHWSAYLTQGQQHQHPQSQSQAAATPGTPGYLPTPESYNGYSHASLGAMSALSTSPPPATPKDTSPHGGEELATKQ
jgi:hypothetical protein